MFDEKKEESMKILEDTQSKIKKSETLLNFIEERLKKLEEEKEDLKEYQKWDKMKRLFLHLSLKFILNSLNF